MASSSPASSRPSTGEGEEVILAENARSVAGRPLPPPAPCSVSAEGRGGGEVTNDAGAGVVANDDGRGSILLFYQYKEPAWTNSEHKKALKRLMSIANRHDVKGRGRVAPEGVNCTLSCASPTKIRAFCQDLRDDWDVAVAATDKKGDGSSTTSRSSSLFHETDFKITDGVPKEKLFKSLSIRKTKELVAYGMDGDQKAPSLRQFAGQHLDAIDYHKAMQDKDAVIIDVRNRYESAIGNFSPPPGGAELIDPKMRNSVEWPKWLASKETQEKINNRKVLMYCTGTNDDGVSTRVMNSFCTKVLVFGTDKDSNKNDFILLSAKLNWEGGIRCERATALLNEMTAVNPNLKPKGVYELRGGIERYIKTFPQGGYWKGKNYLFDRRQEQVPAGKSMDQVEAEIDNARCCVCSTKWTVYRGKYKCSKSLCGVPVIVCDGCRKRATDNPRTLICELCKEGYRAPPDVPDLIGLKRKAEEIANAEAEGTSGGEKKPKLSDADVCPNRIFISKLPLTIRKSRLTEWLGDFKSLHWLTDKDSGAFYGSCMVELHSKEAAEVVILKKFPKFGKKKPRVCLARQKVDDQWPPKDQKDSEYPPIGVR